MELFDYRRPHVGIKMTPESLFQELLREQSSFIFADFSVSFCHGMPCQHTFPLCLLLDICANADEKTDVFGLLKNLYYSNFFESI